MSDTTPNTLCGCGVPPNDPGHIAHEDANPYVEEWWDPSSLEPFDSEDAAGESA